MAPFLRFAARLEFPRVACQDSSRPAVVDRGPPLALGPVLPVWLLTAALGQPGRPGMAFLDAGQESAGLRVGDRPPTTTHRVSPPSIALIHHPTWTPPIHIRSLSRPSPLRRCVHPSRPLFCTSRLFNQPSRVSTCRFLDLSYHAISCHLHASHIRRRSRLTGSTPLKKHLQQTVEPPVDPWTARLVISPT